MHPSNQPHPQKLVLTLGCDGPRNRSALSSANRPVDPSANGSSLVGAPSGGLDEALVAGAGAGAGE